MTLFEGHMLGKDRIGMALVARNRENNESKFRIFFQFVWACSLNSFPIFGLEAQLEVMTGIYPKMKVITSGKKEQYEVQMMAPEQLVFGLILCGAIHNKYKGE